MSSKFVSIVVPALNEELTIAEFIGWCKEGLETAGVEGEIVIVDSSTDKTPEIAESLGARVLRVPKRGLGQAYIDAIPEIKGDYVIMGDCDCTYDFRELKGFIEKLDEGYEYVMGTRMKGYIEKDAMPKLHRYFGTPLTTKILNFMYGSKYSDIHCGMRAMTLDALKKINLESSSWEYASEMVLKSAKLGLKTTEVPIRFYKDKEGRLSHHKRSGWFSPWYAGWINLRVMFEYTPAFFLKKPGILSMFIGMIILSLVFSGIFFEATATFALHWLIAGALLLTVGYTSYQLSILSEVYFGFNPKNVAKYKRRITYNKGMLASAFLGLSSLVFFAYFIFNVAQQNFVMTGISYSFIFGVISLIVFFQTFTFTLMFQMLLKRRYTFNDQN
jgi:glycosyltransferase involved in cell wall biosynthesis